jgi:hypothetical protein
MKPVHILKYISSVSILIFHTHLRQSFPGIRSHSKKRQEEEEEEEVYFNFNQWSNCFHFEVHLSVETSHARDREAPIVR